MSQLCAEFNAQSNLLQNATCKVNSMDVLREPLLIKEQNGLYMVHERSGPKWLYGAHQIDDVNVFSDKTLAERHDTTDLMTLDEYKDLLDTLNSNRGRIDEQTRSQMLYMRDRIEEIDNDMQDNGYTYQNTPQNNL